MPGCIGRKMLSCWNHPVERHPETQFFESVVPMSVDSDPALTELPVRRQLLKSHEGHQYRALWRGLGSHPAEQIPDSQSVR